MKVQEMIRMCGKRTARFLCTLEAGHKGPHGRQYRRVARGEKAMAKMRKRDLSFAVRVTSCGESNHSRARVEAEAILVSVGWGRRPGFPSVATLTVKDRLTRRRFRLQLPVEDLQRAAAYIKETDKRMSERGIIGPYWEDQS